MQAKKNMFFIYGCSVYVIDIVVFLVFILDFVLQSTQTEIVGGKTGTPGSVGKAGAVRPVVHYYSIV